MVLLTISHNIFLSREERYALHKGVAVAIIGTSIPVWVKKGVLPRPAEEIFCRYVLLNTGQRGVTSAADGWTIGLPPKRSRKWIESVSDEEWRAMPEEVKAAWYDKHTNPNPQQLLDIPDGGSGGFLSYVHPCMVKKLTIFHFIQIKPIEVLVESIV